MANKYTNNTSIRFDEDLKPWLYRKRQSENRSLSNLVNTILKREKEREENTIIEMPTIDGKMDYITVTEVK